MGQLDGKVAIITGTTAGMGKATALLFAREGATVVAVARRKERLDELATQAAAEGLRLQTFVGDVSDEHAMDAMVDATLAEHGVVDILVNNAGIMDSMTPAGETDDELWTRVLDVNLTGPFRLCRRVLGPMVERGSGNIINIASVGGVQGSRAGAAYTASKFGLIGLTKNIGFMYANSGIRCNAIGPGGVSTEIAQSGMSHPSEFGLGRAMLGMGTNPRSGEPEEIATIALFLATDASSFVNGAVLIADGGWTAY